MGITASSQENHGKEIAQGTPAAAASAWLFGQIYKDSDAIIAVKRAMSSISSSYIKGVIA
jgi:hypothetical protein